MKVFCYELCEISKNTLFTIFTIYFWTTVSAIDLFIICLQVRVFAIVDPFVFKLFSRDLFIFLMCFWSGSKIWFFVHWFSMHSIIIAICDHGCCSFTSSSCFLYIFSENWGSLYFNLVNKRKGCAFRRLPYET